MDYILKTEALTKQYGKHIVVNSVGMSVRTRTIYGLLGRNGAEKTTILKMLGGLAKPTKGRIYFTDNTKRNDEQGVIKIGTLIEQPGIYPSMSAKQNLKLKCLAAGIKGNEHIYELLDIVGLTEVGDKPVKNSR